MKIATLIFVFCTLTLMQQAMAFSSQDSVYDGKVQGIPLQHENVNNAGLHVPEKDIKAVTWATPAWLEFTQKDGQGVYHDLISAIFSMQGIKTNVIYAPWKRAVETVKDGIYDMTGGIEKSTEFYQSQYPVYEFDDLIIFKKGRIKWNGLESLKGKKGVWVRGYIEDADHPIKKYATGIEVSSHKNGLLFTDAGRADYFFTEKKALENYSKQIKGMDLSDYEIVNIKSGQLYFSFTKNERGKKIRELYDRGIEFLGQETINKIYTKWGLTAPVYDFKK